MDNSAHENSLLVLNDNAIHDCGEWQRQIQRNRHQNMTKEQLFTYRVVSRHTTKVLVKKGNQLGCFGTFTRNVVYTDMFSINSKSRTMMSLIGYCLLYDIKALEFAGLAPEGSQRLQSFLEQVAKMGCKWWKVDIIDSLPKNCPKVEAWIGNVVLDEGNVTILALCVWLMTVLYVHDRQRRFAPAVANIALLQHPNKHDIPAPN